MVIVFASALLLVMALPAHALAADFTWNGGSGYWGDPTKWTPNGVPDADHTAEISAPGTYTVSGSGTVVAKTLTLGGSSGQQTLALVASSTPDGVSAPWANATLQIGGGSHIGANGVLELTGLGEGASHWSSFSVDMSVSVVPLINEGSIRFLPGGGGIRQMAGNVLNQGQIDVAASTTYSGAGKLLNEGSLHVLTGCTFDEWGNTLGFENAIGGSIWNEGVFHFNGGQGFTQGAGTTSGNPILIEGCSLTLTGDGAAAFRAVGTLEVTGTLAAQQTIDVHAGNGYWANASLTVDAPFIVHGQIHMTSGGGGIDTLSVKSAQPGDALTLAAGGGLFIESAGGGTRGLSGNITNEGTIAIGMDTSHSGSGLIHNGGQIVVSPDVTFSAEGNSIGFNNDSGGAIENHGTFYFDGGQGFTQGAGTTLDHPVTVGSVPLAFTGAGDAHFVAVFNTQISGALAPNQSLTTMSGTPYSVNAHTSMSSPFSNAGAIVLASSGGGGGGQCQFGDSTYFTNEGTVSVDWANGGTRQLSCAAHNAGLIRISYAGDWTGVLGAMGLVMDPAGVLEARIGGTAAGTGYDQLASSAPVTLAGTLRVRLVRGFVPALGDAFRVLTTNSLGGTTFSTYDLPTLGSGLGWTVSYDPVNPAVVLTVVVDHVTAHISSVSPTTASTLVKISFSGTATDSAGHAIAGYEWRSSIDGVISTSRTFSTKLLSAGTHTIYFRARCVGGSWSPAVSKKITLKRRTTVVGTPSSSKTVTHGKAFTVSGSLSPSHPATAKGVLLYCYRREGGTWKLKLKVWASASGTKYTAKVTLPTKGSWRIKGYHASDKYSGSDWSSYKTLTAK